MNAIRYSVPLKELNTFGIEATAAALGEFWNEAELSALLNEAERKNMPWTILSGGSNVLFTADYPGLILRPAGKGISEEGGDTDTVLVRAEAGVPWDELVDYCVGRGYGGLENLAGIPGLAGASPIQNIGAYGVEVKDSVESVRFLDVETRRTKEFTASDCRFGYRDSVFKRELKGKAVILSVCYRLSRKPDFRLGYGDLRDEVQRLGGASLDNVRRAVTHIRNSKLPDPRVLGNSGSFFKNPVVPFPVADKLKREHPDIPTYPADLGVKLAAGWLIDRAGMKGYRQGNAGVHQRQALVLVNYGGATGRDILALARKIVDEVFVKFGIELEKEVNVIGPLTEQ